MHLDLQSRAVTAFVTPWGNYQWTVLPMGVKQGPALFQRMVNWALRDVRCARAYVDDILVGTQETRNMQDGLAHQHYLDLRKVLEAFRRYHLTVKSEKIHLF